jgi:hypothetical protein
MARKADPRTALRAAENETVKLMREEEKLRTRKRAANAKLIALQAQLAPPVTDPAALPPGSAHVDLVTGAVHRT